jgi:hypothetical protein
MSFKLYNRAFKIGVVFTIILFIILNVVIIWLLKKERSSFLEVMAGAFLSPGNREVIPWL